MNQLPIRPANKNFTHSCLTFADFYAGIEGRNTFKSLRNKKINFPVSRTAAIKQLSHAVCPAVIGTLPMVVSVIMRNPPKGVFKSFTWHQ